MGTPTGEERKIKAAEWLDETFDAAPVGVDLNDDDTLASPARHGGEAKKRREKKEKRVGAGGVSFASDVAGAGEEKELLDVRLLVVHRLETAVIIVVLGHERKR